MALLGVSSSAAFLTTIVFAKRFNFGDVADAANNVILQLEAGYITQTVILPTSPLQAGGGPYIIVKCCPKLQFPA